MDGAPRALVTGITGQDGSFLAELLLDRGYEVTGAIRPGRPDLGCSEPLRDRLAVVEMDLLDPAGLRERVGELVPDELYHLAAPSYVPASWASPMETFAAVVGATAALLEAVRENGRSTRVFVAGSGAMYGEAPESPQDECTPARPANPYAVAKHALLWLVRAMREREGLFACTGIAFNHESERRPERFVSRRITQAAARIRAGRQSELALGNLGAVRDWSFAGDIMQAAWLMLQQPEPADYVLASGVAHTVGDLVEEAFACVGLDPAPHVRIEESLRRPPESTPSVGNPARARRELGWEPALDFSGLVARMVAADVAAVDADPGGKSS